MSASRHQATQSVTSARLALSTANNNYTTSVAPATDATIAADKAALATSQQAVDDTQAALDHASITAPTDGTVVAQSSATAVVRSTDTVSAVLDKLDALYVTGLGCTDRAAVNKPRDYFCFNPATSRTDEIVFTFAALDPTATDPSRSQSNAHRDEM